MFCKKKKNCVAKTGKIFSGGKSGVKYKKISR